MIALTQPDPGAYNCRIACGGSFTRRRRASQAVAIAPHHAARNNEVNPILPESRS